MYHIFVVAYARFLGSQGDTLEMAIRLLNCRRLSERSPNKDELHTIGRAMYSSRSITSVSSYLPVESV